MYTAICENNVTLLVLFRFPQTHYFSKKYSFRVTVAAYERVAFFCNKFTYPNRKKALLIVIFVSFAVMTNEHNNRPLRVLLQTGSPFLKDAVPKCSITFPREFWSQPMGIRDHRQQNWSEASEKSGTCDANTAST